MRVFLILLLVPILEIWLFLEVGGLIGTWPTLGIILLTAIIGSMMLREQWMKAILGMDRRIASGEAPGLVLAEGVMVLVAAVFLMTPGFFTDTVGFSLLLPPVRRWAMGLMKGTVVHTMMSARLGGGMGGGFGGDDQTIDGTYTEAEDPQTEHKPPQR